MIANHRLTGVRYVRSPSQSPRPLKAPLALVFHYTAGHTLDGAVRTLTKPGGGASAHLVIGRDGEMAQLVDFNRVAWHAGTSVWKGRPKLNDWSIGIELVNLGPVEASHPTGDTVFVGARQWQVYPEPQLAALDSVVKALLEAYPAITELIGHEDICIPKGRKRDPGPAFPWARYRALLATPDRVA